MATAGEGKRGAQRHRKSSHTAAKVARGVVFLARDPVHARLLPEGAAESLESFALAAGALKPWMCRLFDSKLYRKSVFGIVGGLWSGELMRLTLRKRFMDDEARAAIAAGARQLLIVGAGYDTLGLRMAERFPEVNVVEVDTPATAEKRRSAIGKLKAERPNHRVLGADLGAARLGEVLRRVTEWNPKGQTVAIAEGVLMYLAEDDVRGFLLELKNNTGPKSRFLFSYLMADDLGRPQMGRLSGLSRMSLRLAGEPLRWGIREGELESFLSSAGFSLQGPMERYDLGERYLRPDGIDLPVGQVERFAVADCG